LYVIVDTLYYNISIFVNIGYSWHVEIEFRVYFHMPKYEIKDKKKEFKKKWRLIGYF